MLQLLIFIMIFITGIVIITNTDHDGFVGLALFMCVIGPVGALVTSFEKDITAEWVEKDVHVVRTPRLVIVDDGTRLWEFNEYQDVTSINDSTTFLFELTTNVYGQEDIEGIKYVNK